MLIRLKRIYESPGPQDGVRVLVDRLWPRGVRKEDAHVDIWMKSIAPSPALRTWFGHDPARWEVFKERYRDELAHHADLRQTLLQLARKKRVTLLFAAKDVEHTHALVIKDVLDDDRKSHTRHT